MSNINPGTNSDTDADSNNPNNMNFLNTSLIVHSTDPHVDIKKDLLYSMIKSSSLKDITFICDCCEEQIKEEYRYNCKECHFIDMCTNCYNTGIYDHDLIPCVHPPNSYKKVECTLEQFTKTLEDNRDIVIGDKKVYESDLKLMEEVIDKYKQSNLHSDNDSSSSETEDELEVTI
jgi:hypothetical protein